ncbi:MAG: hypothetical protein ABSG67_11775 [Thermoguttaceae bacterium]|jgi:hypothetical protein
MQDDNDILPELIAGGVDPITAIVVNESEKQRGNKNSGCLGIILIVVFIGILYVI